MTDRERAPCPRCGVKLYDKYFGNGGWMPTETETGRHHHHDDCAKHLAARIAELEAALAAEKEWRRKAEADNAELRRALKEDGETMQKAIVIHEKCHVERNEQRMRAVAAEQEAFGARSQLLKAEERADRLREYAMAVQNGGHYEALQPGDLDAPKEGT